MNDQTPVLERIAAALEGIHEELRAQREPWPAPAMTEQRSKALESAEQLEGTEGAVIRKLNDHTLRLEQLETVLGRYSRPPVLRGDAALS